MKVLIENRRTADAERINNNRSLVILDPMNIVMASTAIQSDRTKDEVAKLRYVARDPYQILRRTGHCNYVVKHLHKPDSSELKFKAYNLYPPPPVLSLRTC